MVKKNNILIWIIALVPFPLLYIISAYVLNDIYLFEWTSRHWYCGLWLIVIIACFFRSRFAIVLSYANVAAIILGQVFGDMLRSYNISRISADMTADYKAYLHTHYGVQIWLGLVLLTIIVCATISIIRGKKTT